MCTVVVKHSSAGWPGSQLVLERPKVLFLTRNICCTQMSPFQIQDRLLEAAGMISIILDVRPLTPRAFNPSLEVWRRVRKVPPWERHRLLQDLEPGAIRALWKASMTRYVLDDGRYGKRQQRGRQAAGWKPGTMLGAVKRLLPCSFIVGCELPVNTVIAS